MALKIVGKCKKCASDVYFNDGQLKGFCPACGEQFEIEKPRIEYTLEEESKKDDLDKPKSFSDIAQGALKDISDTTKSYISDAANKVKDSTMESFDSVKGDLKSSLDRAMTSQSTYRDTSKNKNAVIIALLAFVLVAFLLFLMFVNSVRKLGDASETASKLKEKLEEENLISSEVSTENEVDAFSQKPQREGFDETKDIQVGLYSISVPTYFDADIEESNKYRAYAETNGKTAYININSSFDEEDPATYDEMIKEKNHSDYIDTMKGMLDNAALISDELIDVGDVKGYLAVIDGDLKGYHVRQYNFHFPSEKDNNWVYFILIETDTCEYDYKDDFSKILESISQERTVREKTSIVKDRTGLTPKNGFIEELNNLEVFGSMQFDIPCYWELESDTGETCSFYADDGVTAMLIINRSKGSYEKNCFDKESTRNEYIEGFTKSMGKQFLNVKDLEVAKETIGDKTGLYFSFTTSLLFVKNYGACFAFVGDDGDIYSVSIGNSDDCKYSYFDDFIKVVESAKTADDSIVSSFTHKASELSKPKSEEKVAATSSDNNTEKKEKAETNKAEEKKTEKKEADEKEEKEKQEKLQAENAEKAMIKAAVEGKNVSEARKYLKEEGFSVTYTHDYTRQDFNSVIEYYTDSELDEAGFIVTKVNTIDVANKKIGLYVDTTENIASRENKANKKENLEDKFNPLYAVSAVEQYGKEMFPYGFALHQVTGMLAEEPYDDNTWFIKYKCWYKDMFGNKIETECEAKVKGPESNPTVYDFYVYD